MITTAGAAGVIIFWIFIVKTGKKNKATPAAA